MYTNTRNHFFGFQVELKVNLRGPLLNGLDEMRDELVAVIEQELLLLLLAVVFELEKDH